VEGQLKVFLSWSGDHSRKVAAALERWLPNVLQAVEPFMSDEDISLGKRWSSEIARELDRTQVGLVIITRTNVEAPWLNYEAGALGRTLAEDKVMPLLFGLSPQEVTRGPLAQYQLKSWSEETARSLVVLLNQETTTPIDNRRLDVLFGHWWPELQRELEALELLHRPYLTGEIKELTRSLAAARSSRLEELVQEATHLVEASTRQLRQVAQGWTTRPTKDADLLIRCADLVTRSLCGTTEVADEDWWRSVRGQAYLDANGAAAARPGVVVERIFLSANETAMTSVIEMNKGVGVHCYVYSEPSSPRDDPMRNFTIFDDLVMHQDQARAVGREQVFTTDTDEIRHLTQVFQALKRRAVRV
jgi:hypothetical protein